MTRKNLSFSLSRSSLSSPALPSPPTANSSVVSCGTALGAGGLDAMIVFLFCGVVVVKKKFVVDDEILRRVREA